MRRSVSWVSGQVQQGVMVRASHINVFARTGPSVAGGSIKTRKPGKQQPFVVGESVVGGEDKIVVTSKVGKL